MTLPPSPLPATTPTMLLAPFPAVLYRADLDPGKVVCPPYDQIDQPEWWWNRSPYNVSRLLVPSPEAGSYQQAGEELRRWLEEGVLQRSTHPQLYLYRMIPEEGASVTGVVGLLTVEELGGRVLAHEETIPEAAADRLAHLAATRANLDVIMALSDAPGLTAALGAPTPAPLRQVVIDGVRHQLAPLPEEHTAAITRLLDSAPVTIADGHHRYATSLARHRQGDAEAARILAFVAPADRSLGVEPIHRLAPKARLQRERLATRFRLAPADPAPPTTPGRLVLVAAGEADAVELEPLPEVVAELPPPLRQVSTAVARAALWDLLGVEERSLRFDPHPQRLLDELSGRSDAVVVLMAPVPSSVVAEAARAGLRLPQKSTHFSPKPLAGLVMRVF